MRSDQIVAMGWPTRRDIEALGSKLSSVYATDALDVEFDDLLAQLDQIEATPEIPTLSL